MQNSFAQHFCPPQLPACLFRLPRGQVARSGLAMLRLAARRQAKALLRSFMGLLFWHATARSTVLRSRYGIAESSAV